MDKTPDSDNLQRWERAKKRAEEKKKQRSTQNHSNANDDIRNEANKKKPLSERPLGYALAVAGGILGTVGALLGGVLGDYFAHLPDGRVGVAIFSVLSGILFYGLFLNPWKDTGIQPQCSTVAYSPLWRDSVLCGPNLIRPKSATFESRW